ncbi:MAG TPA: ABC transporter permease [Bryobacteraceae bacterium]|nr:ABC transporter permease [Bryobacteraceae bacterium]
MLAAIMTSAGSLWQDFQVSRRVLAKNPVATALSILSIMLGIGLTTGMFGLADAVYLRPFPFERPVEVLRLNSVGDDGRVFEYGWPDYEDMLRAAKGVADLSAFQQRGVFLTDGDDRQELFAYPATRNHFAFLGVQAAVGRASLEDVEGRPAVVLEYPLWRKKFGGDPGIVGKTVFLNGKAFVVSGVMPADFTGVVRGIPNAIWVSTDAWFDTLGNKQERTARGGQFGIIARLRPGVSRTAAAAQLDAAIRGAGKHKPAPAGSPGTYSDNKFALNWKQELTAGGTLLLILGLILFIGCANAAQLRMAQAEARKKELSIRRALGAGRWTLARLLLVETTLLCLVGAGLGLLLASWIMDALRYSVSAVMPMVDLGARLDHRTVIFSVAATVAAVLLAGMAPIRHAARLDVMEILKADQGLAGGVRRQWRKQALVAAQIAVTVLFFGVAVQLVQSARNAAAVRPGFDPGKQMLVLEMDPGLKLPPARWCEQICTRFSALPGVRGATFARRLPLSDSGGGLTVRVEIPGQAPAGVRLNNVGGNYFSLMGTRVLAGRGIEPRDRDGGPLVAVVSQQFAKQLLNGRNQVGEWISIGGKMRQVVGVAEDGPMAGATVHEAVAPYLYLPFAQAPSDDIALLVETIGKPEALEQAIRKELKRFDPGSTVLGSTTLQRNMDAVLALDRIPAALAAGLGAIGFLLTAAGLFGVIQYSMNRRTREIGLRVALGARPVEIRRMVMSESLRIARWGIPIGLLLLGGAVYLTRSLLIGVTPLDPLTYGTSATAAVLVALVAAWLPAARAARVDPMVALRSE